LFGVPLEARRVSRAEGFDNTVQRYEEYILRYNELITLAAFTLVRFCQSGLLPSEFLICGIFMLN
jgi:hypothetical protein